MRQDREKGAAEIKAAFDALFDDFTDEEKLEQEGRLIGFRFLSEVEHVLDERNMTRKELAEAMGISPSFLTQLFTGAKPLSDKHKALFQRVLGIRFLITAEVEATYKQEPEFTFPAWIKPMVLRIVRDFEPDYNVSPTKTVEYNENVAA